MRDDLTQWLAVYMSEIRRAVHCCRFNYLGYKEAGNKRRCGSETKRTDKWGTRGPQHNTDVVITNQAGRVRKSKVGLEFQTVNWATTNTEVQFFTKTLIFLLLITLYRMIAQFPLIYLEGSWNFVQQAYLLLGWSKKKGGSVGSNRWEIRTNF
jgi:hypothetical protein